MPGRFIVLEGPDGSGTTLHSSLLGERLRAEGYDVVLTSEPTDGPIGQRIREILRSGGVGGMALQLLFTADRAEHSEQVIKPALDAGKIVISDRYVPSTLSYGDALGLDVMWLRELNKKFIQPDVTFFLLPPLAVLHERLHRRPAKDALENEKLREHVYAAYERLAEGNPAITVIDTSGDKETVSEAIYTHVKSKL